jgi:hypothetical protein
MFVCDVTIYRRLPFWVYMLIGENSLSSGNDSATLVKAFSLAES